MKKSFLLFPLFLLCFVACEGDDDDGLGYDDDDEYGYEDDDEGYGGGNSEYTLCAAAQIFTASEKIDLQSLGTADIPVEIRSYLAAEFPATEITGAESFRTDTDETLYEVMSTGGVIFVFAADASFICAYE